MMIRVVSCIRERRISDGQCIAKLECGRQCIAGLGESSGGGGCS